MLWTVDDGNGGARQDAVGSAPTATIALSQPNQPSLPSGQPPRSPLEERSFRYRDPVAALLGRVKWWQAFLFALVVYGVGEKILLPHYQGYFHVSGDISTWRPDVRALF